MARTDVYERILRDLENGELAELERKVFQALKRVYPASLTRYDLIEAVFGYRPGKGENLNNNKDDRKIRASIADMFNRGVPIVSNSGGAGYCISIDLEKWQVTLVDLKSKKDSFETKIEATEKIVRRIGQLGRDVIPTDVPTEAVQLSLLEMK